MDYVLAGATEIEASIAAVIAGFVGIIASVGAVLITIRKVRDGERGAARHRWRVMQGYLSEERLSRMEAEQDLYKANLLLIQHGIAPLQRARSVVPRLERPKELGGRREDDGPDISSY